MADLNATHPANDAATKPQIYGAPGEESAMRELTMDEIKAAELALRHAAALARLSIHAMGNTELTSFVSGDEQYKTICAIETALDSIARNSESAADQLAELADRGRVARPTVRNLEVEHV